MSETERQSSGITTARMIAELNEYKQPVEDAIVQVKKNNIAKRIWSHDFTVWKDTPDEISNRLGWLHLPANMPDKLSEIYDFVDEVRGAGFTHALLLGMGGSSLAPELFRLVFGVKSGYIDLAVLDSTDPDAINEAFQRSNPLHTLYIVSTKSGGTIETMSFLKFCYNQVKEVVGSTNVGNHFVAITDPGSGLEKTARELKFRKIYLNDPDIGGRYSALSFFGLVPAALVGVDIELLLERASTFAQHAESDPNAEKNLEESVLLGSAMGVLAGAEREKLTLVLSDDLLPLGAWIEQLVAESTGKEGKGILPVVQTLIDPNRDYSDRFIVCLNLKGEKIPDLGVVKGIPQMSIQLSDLYDVAKEFFRWEFATALSAYFLKINPFDQPNVESAKIQARNLVSLYVEKGTLSYPKDIIRLSDGKTDPGLSDIAVILKQFFSEPDKRPAARTYYSIQAFLKPDTKTDELLNRLRRLIEEKYDKATTIGYGPRFLHSTGQLHKGDSGNGRFIQLITDNQDDIVIPEKADSSVGSVSFSVLKKAQAFGDREALISEGRMVITFLLSGNYIKELQDIEEHIKRI